jgi:hypothetical protein
MRITSGSTMYIKSGTNKFDYALERNLRSSKTIKSENIVVVEK